jgi:lipoyl-dependent peroxiredoxin subunit D
MTALEALVSTFPDAARDVRVNLAAVLAESSLSPRARRGVAYASALASRSPDLAAALASATTSESSDVLDEDMQDDARAAVALMAMNNVFYRFRHMVGKPSYASMPARLRMSRIAKPRTGKAEFELLCLAVSAIEGCEACVQAHERSVLELGLGEAEVLDAVRIAAVVRSAAATLSMNPELRR